MFDRGEFGDTGDAGDTGDTGDTGDAGVFAGFRHLEELAGRAAGVDVAHVDGADAMKALLGVERSIDSLRAAAAKLASRLEEDGSTITHAGLGTGAWLAHVLHQPSRACRVRVRTAVTLHRHFPDLAAALEEGRVGWAHVEVIVGASNLRNRSDLAAECGGFVAAASGDDRSRFDNWASRVRDIANLLDQDGGYDPNEDLHANRLRIGTLPDRTKELAGRLVGESGVTVSATLESIADELFLAFSRDAELDPSLEMPSRRTLMALALVEACRRAGATDLHGTKQPKVEATVVITQDAATGQLDATDHAGEALAVGSLEALLGDATFRGLLLDGDDNPLVLGRSRRFATPEQKAALAVRDGGCIFPGCDRPPGWCDSHHQPPYSAGGSTDINRMALLCRRHHGITHRTGWAMRADPERPQRWLWSTPSGHTLVSQRQGDRSPPDGR